MLNQIQITTNEYQWLAEEKKDLFKLIQRMENASFGLYIFGSKLTLNIISNTLSNDGPNKIVNF